MIVFSDHEELENAVKEFVPKLFINVLQSHKTQYEMLPFTVRREWDSHIFLIKDLLIKKIIDFFKKGSDNKPGTILTLGKNDINTIIDECMQELEA